MRSRLALGLTATFLLSLTSASVAAQEPPDTAAGRACIDRWIQEVPRRLNAHEGSAGFNSHKPWSINRYGLFVGRGIRSNAAPDDWSSHGADRHRWMWAFYSTEEARPSWNNADFHAAGLPGLRWFVRRCVAGSASSSGGGDFTGTWSCPGRGPMTIEGTPNALTGTYTWSGGGRIAGRVVNGRLEATWHGPSRHGTWSMGLSPDGNRIDGTWTFSTGGSGRWGCTRARPQARSFLGRWMCPGRGALTLERSGGALSGVYEWSGGGTVSASVRGDSLTATWTHRNGRAAGTWALTLSADGQSFSGRWTFTRGGRGSGAWGCRRP